MLIMKLRVFCTESAARNDLLGVTGFVVDL